MTFSTAIFDDAAVWEQVPLDRAIPTRLVHGVNDDVVPIEQSRQFALNRPWIDFEELDSDHGLLSHSEWIVKDCLQFLKREGFLV